MDISPLEEGTASEETIELSEPSGSQEQGAQSQETPLNPQIKAYLDTIIQNTAASLAQSMRQYMDQQFETMNRRLIIEADVGARNNEKQEKSGVIKYKATSRKFPTIDYSEIKQMPSVQGLSNQKAIETKQIRLWWIWKSLAFGLLTNIQEFSHKNMIDNVKHMSEDTILQTTDGSAISIGKPVWGYDEDRRIALIMNRDIMLFDRNIEAEGKNFDAFTAKKLRNEGWRPGWADTTWYDSKEICLNWNKKSCTEDKACNERIKDAAHISDQTGIARGTVQSVEGNNSKYGAQPTVRLPNNRSYTAQKQPTIRRRSQNYGTIKPKYFNATTSINKIAFEYLTRDHPNREFVQYLRNGIKHGFRFNFNGKHTMTVQENLKLIEIAPEAFEGYIMKEIKDTNPKAYGVISHLSALCGTSVNDGIDIIEFATKYENLNHAIGWIMQYGAGCLLSKVDIQDAYRILLVHPVDQTLQGLQYNSNIYFDKSLAFGNRASGGRPRIKSVLTHIGNIKRPLQIVKVRRPVHRTYISQHSDKHHQPVSIDSRGEERENPKHANRVEREEMVLPKRVAIINRFNDVHLSSRTPGQAVCATVYQGARRQ
ncbi:hypothetical protein C2G38_2159543 [Gigaspora rosea]|uniref:Uncharacterized protein n=1 Tax=Gigaspora rosea TaxID=44941 RepID=A0A397W2L0_9GLOM|nr:hypothetical protein C2G38_2159543 [Gigaspora rosea]